MTEPVEDEGFDPDEEPEDPVRRGRGFLATDVYIVCRDFVAGEFTLEEGKFMSPYIIARILKEKDDLDKAPSSGAVAAVLHRWEDWGFAVCRQEPFAFTDFTTEGRELGLQKFLEMRREGIVNLVPIPCPVNGQNEGRYLATSEQTISRRP